MNESGIRVSRVPRCQVPALPELTEVGGRRCHSNDLAERDGLFPQLGSGPGDGNRGSGCDQPRASLPV